MPDEADIRQALASLSYPGFRRDIVSFGIVKGIRCGEDGAVEVDLALTTRDADIPKMLEAGVKEVVEKLEGVSAVTVNLRVDAPPTPGRGADPSTVATPIPGVKRLVAVASGKGGVGKSTVAANLAVALAARGNRVGLCDCDLYGPSIALMFGAGDQQPMANAEERIIPIEAHGIQLMSMGFLLDDKSPVIVRGPIATRYTQQFLRQVAWDDLDMLILDLPPGTGDIQLTIVQTVALDGSVIVTTPQEVALTDARKAVSMFDKVNVPILGLIENMSWFECPSDGKRYHLFGRDGGVREAQRLGVPPLGQIPLTEQTRESGDQGAPVATADPSENPAAHAFHAVADRLVEELNNRPAPAGS